MRDGRPAVLHNLPRFYQRLWSVNTAYNTVIAMIGAATATSYDDRQRRYRRVTRPAVVWSDERGSGDE